MHEPEEAMDQVLKTMEGAMEIMLQAIKPAVTERLRFTLAPYVHVDLLDEAVESVWGTLYPNGDTEAGLQEILDDPRNKEQT